MVAENLEQVRKNIELACKEAGRDPKEVTLISVSKTKPDRELHVENDTGPRDIG